MISSNIRAAAGLVLFVTLMSLVETCPAAARDHGGGSTQAREVGLSDILDARTIDGLTLSADGKRVAFRVVEPFAKQNRTVTQWYAAYVDGRQAPVPLGGPQAPIWMPQFGMIDDPIAQWTPDGRHLAILTENQSAITVHALGERGSELNLVHDDADIRSFHIIISDRALRYTTGESRRVVDLRAKQATLQGIHLDQSVITDGLRLTENYKVGNRFATMRHGDHPLLVEDKSGADIVKTIKLPAVFSSEKLHRSAAITSGTQVLDVEHLVDGNSGFHPLADGTRISIETIPPSIAASHATEARIVAVLPDGRRRVCEERFCQGPFPSLRQIMIMRGMNSVIILANKEYSGHPTLYAWTPSTNEARVLWQGGGALSNGAVLGSKLCPIAANLLICVFAAPSRPPELMAIDLATGKVTILCDPNAALARHTYPVTRFMRWKGLTGATVTGVFVEPVNHLLKPPVVITTYNCPGFLQGGTAQVTPEFALAMHGIASLCLNVSDAGMEELFNREKLTPLQLHKYALATLDLVVQDLANRQMIDPTRVGISGQSFSSNVVAYAISHSHLFRAASLGTGVTIDPGTYYLTAPTRGSWRKAAFSSEGLPPPDDDPTHIWDRESPALNARNIDAALLIQAPENEYLFALQLYTSIADANGVVDMFIYPHSGHMLGEQPAQRLSRAQRSVDWFRYWLNGERDLSRTAKVEVNHWVAIDRERSAASPPLPHINGTNVAPKPLHPAGA